jgi:hypothetical protein
MEPATATGDITTLILSTESHRREMEKTSGPGSACNEALRRLHEALARERVALQAHEPAARQHSANIAALKREIVRINALAGDAGPGAISAGRRAAPRAFGQHDPFRSFPRSKGRRTMGRGER